VPRDCHAQRSRAPDGSWDTDQETPKIALGGAESSKYTFYTIPESPPLLRRSGALQGAFLLG
jgi:hypothetical protein